MRRLPWRVEARDAKLNAVSIKGHGVWLYLVANPPRDRDFFLSLHFLRAAGNYIVPRRASPLVGTSAVGSVVSVLHGGLRVCRSFLAGCSRGWLVQCKVRCATLAARSRSAEALGVFLLLSPRCPTLHSSPPSSSPSSSAASHPKGDIENQRLQATHRRRLWGEPERRICGRRCS